MQGGSYEVEFVAPGHERWRKLDDGITAVVGPTDEAEFEEPLRQEPVGRSIEWLWRFLEWWKRWCGW